MIRVRAVWVWAVVCAHAILLRADQITLQNGDRITGKVVKKDEKSLTFKSDVFGEVKMPWSKVQALTTDEPVYVVLPDNRTVLGTVMTEEERLRVAAAEAQAEIPFSELQAIRNAEQQRVYERFLHPGWTQLWAGTGTLGFAGTRGNADALTFTVGLNAARVTRRDKTSIYFNSIRASAEVDGVSAPTARAARGGLAYSRDFATRFTWNFFNDYEHDRFQSLDLRYVLGGGGGLVLWKGERSRFDVVGGGAYNRESFRPEDREPFVRTAGEVYMGNDFNYKLNQTTSVYQNLRFFTNLTETGDYRLNVDMGANTKLTKWLTWNSSVSNRNLSNPVQGRQTNDVLYQTGIGVSFAK